MQGFTQAFKDDFIEDWRPSKKKTKPSSLSKMLNPFGTDDDMDWWRSRSNEYAISGTLTREKEYLKESTRHADARGGVCKHLKEAWESRNKALRRGSIIVNGLLDPECGRCRRARKSRLRKEGLCVCTRCEGRGTQTASTRNGRQTSYHYSDVHECLICEGRGVHSKKAVPEDPLTSYKKVEDADERPN